MMIASLDDPDVENSTDREPRSLRPWFIVGLLLLLGLLILAHGCHGDDDHELFSALSKKQETTERDSPTPSLEMREECSLGGFALGRLVERNG
jgi:hypothetical protein